jgi:hypothetical protein
MRLERFQTLVALARAGRHDRGPDARRDGRAPGSTGRTAERMRDARRRAFPQMVERTDGRTKRFSIPGGPDRFLQAPTSDQLAELERALARCS